MKIVGTGHRPNKLGNAYELMHPINIKMGKRMREVILNLSGYNQETNTFRDSEVFTIVSGMAIGFDTVWAMVTLKLKKQFPGKFRLECAIPCKNQEKKWKKVDQERYHSILKQADEVVYVSQEAYTNYCMIARDKHMVNDADYVYGICDGSDSGTKKTLDYAKKKEVHFSVDNPAPWIREYKVTKSVS